MPKRLSILLTNASRRDYYNPSFVEKRDSYYKTIDDVFTGTETTEPFTTPVKRLEASPFFKLYLKYNLERISIIYSFERGRIG